MERQVCKHWFFIKKDEANNTEHQVIKTLISADQKNLITTDKNFGLLMQKELKKKIENKTGIMYDMTDIKTNASEDERIETIGDLQGHGSRTNCQPLETMEVDDENETILETIEDDDDDENETIEVDEFDENKIEKCLPHDQLKKNDDTTSLDDNFYICGKCMLITQGHDNARIHVDGYNKNTCLWCFEKIKNCHMFHLHFKIHGYSAASKAKYICCPFCGNWFRNLEIVKDHISKFHAEKEAKLGPPHFLENKKN